MAAAVTVHADVPVLPSERARFYDVSIKTVGQVN